VSFVNDKGGVGDKDAGGTVNYKRGVKEIERGSRCKEGKNCKLKVGFYLVK